MRLQTFLFRSQFPVWAVLALFGSLELWSTWGNIQATRLAGQAQQEVLQVQQLMKTVVDLETGIRGYAITGETAFLEPYNQARGRFQMQLVGLQQFEVGLNDPDTPMHTQQLRDIDEAVQTWIQEVATYEIIQRPSHPERVVEREKSGRGKRLVDRVRTVTARFGEEEARELQVLQQSAAQATLINQLVTLIGVVGAIVASVLSNLFVSRSLSLKFGRLAGMAEQLAATGHATRVEHFHLFEAARLADSFNSMADKLEASHERLLAHNQQLNLQNAEVLATNELAEQLQTCFTLDEGYLVLRHALPQLFQGTRGSLAVMNASKNLMELQVRWSDDAGGVNLPAELGVVEPDACWATRTGRIYDLQQRPFSAPCAAHEGAVDHLCLPLLAHGEVIGTIRLTGIMPGRPRLRELAVTVANQVGLGLSNLRLRETLRSQSIRDPLTGLYNRRYLDETFEREIRRAERHRRPVTVLMLDVDHFKRFNDTHGHEAGDRVLMSLGRLLQEHFRREDIVCRYGGEEFAVLMPDAAHADGLKRAESLREAASRLKLEHQGRPLGGLTISVGVSTFPEQGADMAQLIRLADQALYRAKQDGRNRVQSSLA